MSEYREELINSVDEQSQVLRGVTQVDVTSTGNYTASWMEQAKQDRDYRNLAEVESPIEPLPLDTQFEDYSLNQLQQDDVIPDFEALDMPEVEIGEPDNPLPQASNIPPPTFEEIPQAGSVEKLLQNLEEPESFKPELTKTQEKVQARRGALLSRQGSPRQPKKDQPVEALPNPLQAMADEKPVKQDKPEPAEPPPQTRTEQDAATRGEALRQRHARSQDPAFDMEIGETNETRQPNFREASTAMNASVSDFATTVADQFEDQAQALSVATARIRALERIVREAMR